MLAGDIRNILVAGAGMMGKNIAFVFSSLPECSVSVYDVNETDVKAGIIRNTEQLVAKGIISENELEERLGRIRFTTDIDSPMVADTDMVVECVFEDMDIKKNVFSELECRCSKDAIFCTNTSVMSPSEISSGLRYRERFVGTHFWNPGHLIPLVEVVRSDATSDETADAVMEILERAGKKPVLCRKDVPGFIANRMQHALWREAISIVEEGIADARTVDDAVKYSFGLRLPQLGPIENSDMVGTQLTYNIHRYILPFLADNHEPSRILKDMLEKNELGFSTRRGFLEYTDEDVERSSSALNEYLIKMLYGK